MERQPPAPLGIPPNAAAWQSMEGCATAQSGQPAGTPPGRLAWLRRCSVLGQGVRCGQIVLLLVALALSSAAQSLPQPPSSLRLAILAGDGSSFAAGRRAGTVLTIEVTDDQARPIPQARVAFRLPVEGPSGLCSSGLPTEVVTTDRLGRAALSHVQWNLEPGPVPIQVVAQVGSARVGSLATVTLLPPDPATAARRVLPLQPAIRPNAGRRWRTVTLFVAAAAGAGLAARMAGRTSPSPPAAAPPPLAPPQIGTPSITVGKP